MLGTLSPWRSHLVKEKEPSQPDETPDAKAKKLLYRFLTAEQRDSLERSGYFDVLGHYSVYRLGKPRLTIQILRQGCGVVGRLCVQTVSDVPDADWYLTMLLMIQADEDTFLKHSRRLNDIVVQPDTGYH